MNDILLKSDEIELRPIEFDDLDFIFCLQQNKQTAKILRRPIPETIITTKEFVLRLIEGHEKKDWLFWIIEDGISYEKIGTICLWHFDKTQNTAEIGFECLVSHRRKGYGYSASIIVLNYAREILKLKTVFGVTYNDNEPSKHILAKLGFDWLYDVGDECFYKLNL